MASPSGGTSATRAARRGSQGRRADAAFERGSFPHHGPGPDLGHLLAVDLDDEDAVEDQEDVRAGGALLEERVAGRDGADLRLGAATHDARRQLPFQARTRRWRRRPGESDVPHGVRSPNESLNQVVKSTTPDFSTSRPAWS